MMRRAEKELKQPAQIEDVLTRARVIRLALMDEREPYIVPLLFGYDGKRLYFHSACEGRKINILQNNPRVCFECEVDVEIRPADNICSWSVGYRSVIGYGVVSIITDLAEKRKAMGVLLNHYTNSPYEIPDVSMEKTCMFAVEIEAIQGKGSLTKEG